MFIFCECNYSNTSWVQINWPHEQPKKKNKTIGERFKKLSHGGVHINTNLLISAATEKNKACNTSRKELYTYICVSLYVE